MRRGLQAGLSFSCFLFYFFRWTARRQPARFSNRARRKRPTDLDQPPASASAALPARSAQARMQTRLL
ncbi:hypothetical protein N658DRAFT_198553 [Parathielavia hyrcaniae]|uniref:Uncharacterized protein n=1 Tax=Parathielavia hyrcaniae TaxID=113614 RepID=A0AAN6Q7G2_9PEZI|nr:hypothetical protein N658DRAFT_198553 [Parathielavia hyrcaniae]